MTSSPCTAGSPGPSSSRARAESRCRSTGGWSSAGMSPRRLDDARPSRLGDGHRRAGTRPRSMMMRLTPAA
jgi:hypothetical protein